MQNYVFLSVKPQSVIAERVATRSTPPGVTATLHTCPNDAMKSSEVTVDRQRSRHIPAAGVREKKKQRGKAQDRSTRERSCAHPATAWARWNW